MKCTCRKDGQSDGKQKQQGVAAQPCVVPGSVCAHQKGGLPADPPSNGIAREREGGLTAITAEALVVAPTALRDLSSLEMLQAHSVHCDWQHHLFLYTSRYIVPHVSQRMIWRARCSRTAPKAGSSRICCYVLLSWSICVSDNMPQEGTGAPGPSSGCESKTSLAQKPAQCVQPGSTGASISICMHVYVPVCLPVCARACVCVNTMLGREDA